MTTNNIDAKAIEFFKNELEHIKDDNLKAFFYNALAVAPQSFHDDQEAMTFVKKAFYILDGLLKHRGVEGSVKDAMLGTVLLCDIMINEFEESMERLHSVAVRPYLEEKKVNLDIQAQFWENILRAIESHHGDKGASPILNAQPGSAEHEIANAFAIARLPYISIEWEVITNES